MGDGFDLRRALAERVVLFDGAMGTMLMARSLRPGQAPEALTFTRPEIVREVHLAYLDAGAEVLQTNTFGGNALRLPEGLDVDRVNERAAEIALGAVRDRPGPALVAGDIGPTGRFLPPVGDLTPEAARAAFREQARALARAGVDLLLVETMTDVREAVSALRAVREVSDLPVFVTMTFDRKPRGYFTLMGDSPAGAAGALLAEGADGVGANCTLAATEMVGLAAELRAATGAPILVQPNFGGESATNCYDTVIRIVDAGANAVGGCCGSGPEDIRAIADRLAGGRG